MIDVAFAETNAWGTGFQGAIAVSNGGDAPLQGWRLSFTASFGITQIWGARIVSRQGDRYVVENLSWNAAVPPDGRVEFGFIATPGAGGNAIGDVALNGLPVGGTEPEPAPPPAVSVADASVSEGDAASVVLTLDRASEGPVTVAWETRAGSAGTADFQPASGSVTFAPGETRKTISVATREDALVEAAETFDVVLTRAEGVTVADGRASVAIRDDDVAPPPVVSAAPAVSVAEGDPGAGAARGWLSTRGRDIVDETGAVVKLTGVNWFGAETVRKAPDGLFARNWKDMMDQMAELGFNAIRLPFSNDALRPGAMPTDIDYSLNPELTGLTSLEVIDRIVEYAGEIGLRIVLDNHRNAAGDGASANGLWYGEGYSEAQWIADWAMLARRYADEPAVAGFDLSNEPHAASWGTGDPARDWRLGAEKAIAAIHAENPEVLVLVEGIGGDYWWGGNLKGVRDAPVRLEQTDKLVYSPHTYPNSIYPQPWFSDPAYPSNLLAVWDRNWGYIAKEGIAPVLVGEFGSRLQDPKDVAWFDAFVPYLAENGLSWTFWSWNPNSGDTGGILADDWRTVLTAKTEGLAPALGEPFGEDGGLVEAEIAVTLSAASAAPVTVAWATADGTAEAGVDYEAASGILTFAPGQTTATIRVALLPDLADGPDRSFSVVLTDPSGATLGTATAQVTIRDDDDAAAPPPPALSIADATVDEGAGRATVTLTLDRAADRDVAVALATADGTATAGSDYAPFSGSVVIRAGATSATVSTAILDDALVEGAESFLFEIASASGAAVADARAAVTIRDDDAAPPPGGGAGEGVFAEIDALDAWSGGFVARVATVNGTAGRTAGWTVEMTTDAEIVNIWNARIVSREGDTYRIGDVGYNAAIAAGGEAGWGFQGAGPAILEFGDSLV